MDKEEFKRLERAMAKTNKKANKQALYDWGIQFEETLLEKLRIEYEKKFKKDLATSIDYFVIAINYVLHFNEKCKFGAKRLKDVMDDITATVDMFTRGEYSPEDYIKELKAAGIDLENSKGE